MQLPHGDFSLPAKQFISVYENCHPKIRLIQKCRHPESRGNIRCANLWDTLWECYSAAICPKSYEATIKCLHEEKIVTPGCERILSDLDTCSANFWDSSNTTRTKEVVNQIGEIEDKCRKNSRVLHQCYLNAREAGRPPSVCDKARFTLFDCFSKAVNPTAYAALTECRSKHTGDWEERCESEMQTVADAYAKKGDDLLSAVGFKHAEIVSADREYFHKVVWTVLDAVNTASRLDPDSHQEAFPIYQLPTADDSPN